MYHNSRVLPTKFSRTSAGDAARTIQLLWRDSAAVPQRGPRPRLSIDQVVAAALSLADAHGLEAVTMRRLAASLGVVPMSLYTYVPGKAELLDLMLDAAYATMPRTDTTGQPWRQRLTAVASENKALYDAHSWVAAVSTIRPPLGPGVIAKYEHELSAFDGLCLDDVTTDACLTYLLSFVESSARAAINARVTWEDSAVDDQQWWSTNAPLLARFLDTQAYPRATRIGAAAGAAHGSAYNPDHAYEFGLQRTLDAIAVLVSPGQSTKLR
jgi:AcrR family transcriptional regulator